MAEQAVGEQLKEPQGLPPDQVLIEGADTQQQDIIVNDKGEEIQAAPKQEDDDDQDERIVATQAGDAAESEVGKTDAEREAIRERRREEKRRKRENFQNMKRELGARDTAISALQEQLNILQRKSAGGEMAQLDQALKQTSEA